jgi:drug/metabolite transporter (DMT)-like permease
MMGILLGLATALSWGSADLCARFATRKIGTFRTMLYMQLTGFVLLTLLMPLLGGWGHLMDGSGPRVWAWGILAGCLNTSSTLALYRSFEIGKVSIVAPVSASYPVLTMLLSMFTGERLTMIRLIGMALAILGVVLVARGENIPADANLIDATTQPQKQNLGVGWALYSAFGFGVMFWLLGIRIVPLVGAIPSVWIIRLTSVIAAALVILVARSSMAAPAQQDAPWILGTGVLDTSAYAFNNFGMRLEQISVVSVLASLYGAVTVGLAAMILHERISRMQWLGIVLIFAGIVLISR